MSIIEKIGKAIGADRETMAPPSFGKGRRMTLPSSKILRSHRHRHPKHEAAGIMSHIAHETTSFVSRISHEATGIVSRITTAI
jgi:hypothetical protein